MFRSYSLHAIYYTVDLLNTNTDHVYINIPLQDQIYSTGDCNPISGSSNG